MSSGAAGKALHQHAFETDNDLAQPFPDPSVSAIAALLRPAPDACSSDLPPFPEKEYVDMARAARILGVTDSTVSVLFKKGLIGIIDYAPHKRKRVRYQSIVEFCDQLRQRYAIADRRPPLGSSVSRHKDSNLLPFPIQDTIGIEQAAKILGYGSVTPVRLMIEEGRFEAYQFYPSSPWRISKLSLATYIAATKSSVSPRISSNRNREHLCAQGGRRCQ